MLCESKHCVKYNKYHLPRDKKSISFFTGLLLIVLPKCPFCFIAYSSTFVLCSEAGTFTTTNAHSSSTTFLLSVLFCGITLAGIVFNYRDNRTRYSLLLALTGSACVLFSVAKSGGLALYYSGVLFIFFGVWLNGSLLFLFRKISGFFIRTEKIKSSELMIKNRD